AEGIDLSPRMVEIATQKGVKATNRQISSVKENFDAIVAVGDVLNYLRRDELKSFLVEVARILNSGGIFICDVNTLIGFEEVTAGSMSADFGNQFLSIDAEYLEGILTTEITLFEQIGGDCFQKEQDTIFQFYHDRQRIEESTPLKLLKVQELGMFCDEDDKTIFIFQKA
ncbi:MAG TPA: methyltransferase domain-containing protein, partial [Campylobacterales bacterium]|nr:methyltransferase domain-containing protein [Campylobacterales bacterium]